MYAGRDPERMVKLKEEWKGIPYGGPNGGKESSLGHSGTYTLHHIVYRHLYSASQGVNQTQELSVHISSRKKVRLKARERQGKGSKENRRAKRRKGAIPE